VIMQAFVDKGFCSSVGKCEVFLQYYHCVIVCCV